MKRNLKLTLNILADAIFINCALYVALLIRFDGLIPENFQASFINLAPSITIITLICFYFFGLYNRIWKYASIGELLIILYAVTAALIFNIAIVYFRIKGPELPLPRSVFLLNWLLNIFFIGGLRLAWRLFREHKITLSFNRGTKTVLIYGAGDSGLIAVKELKRHFNGQINIIGFIDDDPAKQNLKVLGIPVLGDRTAIEDLVDKFEIQEIILAIPSADGKSIRDIVAVCQNTKAKLKIIPGMQDIIEGNITINNIREVRVEDLLGREPVKVDLNEISQYLNEKVALVTGAGGSIGSELCRQIINFSPAKLLLFDVCENNVYEIEMELRKLEKNVELIPLVKDVRDKNVVSDVFEKYKPEVIFHAAAHKHVPLMELNPEEAVKNNVFGTLNVALAAKKYEASKFVLISTDKAVNPVSIMGATKRAAEIFIQYLDKTSKTNYVAVRFGNVLGSRGSVVPLFKKQISEGGPVTVTHPEMIRYFMTIPEAVQLVIQAGSMAKGGEIFILDMGEPVKILDLAKTLIKLSGFEPGKDIEIIFSGIRPGERLYEELLTAEEGINATSHKRIFVAKPNNINALNIESILTNIALSKEIFPKNINDTEKFLQKLITDFRMGE